MPKAPKTAKGPAKGIYAVHVGKTKGVYFTWPECEKQIKGVVNAKFKKFDSLKEAEEFVKNGPKVFTKPLPKAVAAAAGRASPYPINAKASTSASSSASATTKTNANSTGKDNYVSVNGVRVAASDTIVAYTDGSALSNGKASSQAGLGVFFGVNDPRNVSERLEGEPQTNQRAELMAALRALEACGSDTAPIEIRTDIVTQWADGWIKNNWRKNDGSKVQNQDIIEPLIAKTKSRPGPIKWLHVRAHIGIFGNEMADKLANEGAVKPMLSTL
ncbi:hypothetical protein BGZ76_004216 [Entomortierella beljakovae]|nr:hypothetical protein BGZ76_004216 [Entomortierella beljakovae]